MVDLIGQHSSSKPKAFSKETVMAIAALCGARIIMSLTPILTKFSDREIGPSPTIFWREAIAFMLFGVIEGSLFLNRHRQGLENQSKKEQPYNIRTLWLLLATGVTATGYITLWIWAINLTSVTNCTMFDSFLPIFTTLGAWLLFGQVFDRSFLIGMAITIGGAAIIGLNDFSQMNSKIYGDLLALLSIAFYATYYLLIEQLRVGLSTTKILLWRCGIGSTIMFPLLLMTNDQIFPDSWQGWSLVIAIAILGQVLSQGLTIYCLKKLSSGLVALSLLVVPVLSALEAGAILSERLNWFNFVGAVLVISGMYVAISSNQGAIKD